MDIKVLKQMVIEEIRNKISSVVGNDYDEFIREYRKRKGDYQANKGVYEIPLRPLVVPTSQYYKNFCNHMIIFLKDRYEFAKEKDTTVKYQDYFDVVSGSYYNYTTLLKDRPVETLLHLSETIDTVENVREIIKNSKQQLIDKYSNFKYVRFNGAVYKIIEYPFLCKNDTVQMKVQPIYVNNLNENFGRPSASSCYGITICEEQFKNYEGVSESEFIEYLEKCAEKVMERTKNDIKSYEHQLEALKKKQEKNEIFMTNLKLQFKTV